MNYFLVLIIGIISTGVFGQSEVRFKNPELQQQKIEMEQMIREQEARKQEFIRRMEEQALQNRMKTEKDNN